MRRINLVFGILLLLGFLGTGLYLMLVFKPAHLANLSARMEIRANHIYILFIALLNIFTYGIPAKLPGTFAYYSHSVFRGLLVVAGILAVAAFFNEHSGTLTNRKFTFYAVLLSLVAAGIYLICLFLSRKSAVAEKP
jgi:hypothetical protein